jgi:hypothetical protein
MLKKIKSKFDEELKRISNLVQGELANLKKFMENPLKAHEQNINARQSVTDIFKAHYLVIDLAKEDPAKDRLAKDQADFKTKFFRNIEEKLADVTVVYNQKVTNQPQENLSSI